MFGLRRSPFVQADWSKHKAVCKALRELEDAGSSMSLHFFNLAKPVSEDPETKTLTINREELGELVRLSLHADIHSFEQIIGRSTNILERNLFGWEPRCAAWCVKSSETP